MPRISAILLILATLSGCGVKSVTGGTGGTLRVGGEWFSDIQVTIHHVDGSLTRTLGFGVTDAKGAFKLLKTGARGALWLDPAEYRCTLESAGAPVVIPEEYARAETTPLKVSLSGKNGLDLEVPTLPASR